MDKIRHAQLCPTGQEMERFAEGQHRAAELHGKKFWEIVQRSMDAGQKLETHIEGCEVCKAVL